MEITGDEYRVHLDEGTAYVVFEGALRLAGSRAYKPIAQLLQETGQNSTATIITLDMRKLNFLNSAGINMLYKFALTLRQRGGIKLIVRGSKDIPWQKKVLRNLSHFIDDFELDFA